MWGSHCFQKCLCKHEYCPLNQDVEYPGADPQFEAVLRASKTGDEHLDYHHHAVASVLMAPAQNGHHHADWAEPTQKLTKEEYEARFNKLQQMMVDLKASAPLEAIREQEQSSYSRGIDRSQAPLHSHRSYSSEDSYNSMNSMAHAGHLSWHDHEVPHGGHMYDHEVPVPEVKTLLALRLNEPTLVARHAPVHSMHSHFVDDKTYREELLHADSQRGAPRPGQAPTQTLMKQRHLSQSPGRVENQDDDRVSDSLAAPEPGPTPATNDHIDRLQTAWAELEKTKSLIGSHSRPHSARAAADAHFVAADAAEKEVLAMLAADSTDCSSDGGRSTQIGSQDASATQAKAGIIASPRDDSRLSQDGDSSVTTMPGDPAAVGVMLDEVKRLDQLREDEDNPQQKEELKRKMRAEMKALLGQVQKAKAQLKNAQLQAQDSSRDSSAPTQAKTLTDRKTWEERRGYQDKDEPLPLSRGSDPYDRKSAPGCMRNCAAFWPGQSMV